MNFDRIAEPPRPCCWPQGAPLEDLGTNFCPSFRRALKPVWELCNALISGKLGVHLGSAAPLFRSTILQFFSSSFLDLFLMSLVFRLTITTSPSSLVMTMQDIYYLAAVSYPHLCRLHFCQVSCFIGAETELALVAYTQGGRAWRRYRESQ